MFLIQYVNFLKGPHVNKVNGFKIASKAFWVTQGLLGYASPSGCKKRQRADKYLQRNSHLEMSRRYMEVPDAPLYILAGSKSS